MGMSKYILFNWMSTFCVCVTVIVCKQGVLERQLQHMFAHPEEAVSPTSLLVVQNTRMSSFIFIAIATRGKL